ncbi:MAG TPA: hypothetical protein ENH62_07810 [Marinobacter sp.]|uniref:Uncharacterized protein n=1 Tax=marine sediment metagenome TaxID=412755 RepID=A0A0F9PWF4_9ZZZZ|nr:hypothetical protein [Marinobacter sp.]|tara:strand:+ start:250 stop:1056 length:807 start_codon:yes stop_codon:yes gene_type:complete
MPLDNGKVMIPWPLAEEILTLSLTAPTLRLAFSMLHRLDLEGVCGPNGPEECPLIWAGGGLLRERVGPKGSNDARTIRAAAEALTHAGVLERANLLENATKLQWQFSTWVWYHMRNRDPSNYVLVDLEELGRFRSTYRISLYLIARKVRGSNAPQFEIRYDNNISEEANIRRLWSGLRLVSEVLGVICYSGLEMRSDIPAPDCFKVKMRHAATLWRHRNYAQFDRPKMVWRVDRSGHAPFISRSINENLGDPIDLAEQGLDQQVISGA